MAFNKKQYFTHATYHVCLLMASFIFLPRWSTPGEQKTSADRPEHPFLTPITSNPLKTMAFHILGEFLCMMLWGQHLRTWAEGSIRSKVREERVKRTAKRLKEAMIGTLVGIPVLTIIITLLGANIDHVFHTILLATHASILLIWPVLHAFGLPGSKNYRFIRIFSRFSSESAIERAILLPVLGGVAGGWLGGALLALDWDRPWQAYPLTPAFGMIIGYGVATCTV